MGEFRYAKGRIMESLAYITKEMAEFDSDYASKTWQDYATDSKIQKLTDRTVENILTAFIEVCGTVLNEEDILAENYADVMRKTGGFFNFNEEEVDTLARFAVQRNRLAHRYLNFRWQVIKFYDRNRNVLKKMLNCIYEYEKKKQE